MVLLPDTRYGGPSAYDYVRRAPDNEVRLCAAALDTITRPASQLRTLVRPPLPQIQLMPPRFGYEKREPGLLDVLDADAVFGNPRVDYSGRTSGYQGSAYPSLNQF